MTQNICAMSEACAGRPADHGMMCEACREEDRAIYDPCDCAVCWSDPGRAGIVPCQKEADHAE